MNRSKIASLLLTLLVCACSKSSDGGGGGVSAPPIRNAKPGAGRIAILGDSLAAGTGASNSNVTPEGCLSNAFRHPMTNLASRGSTSGEALERAEELAALSPKLVFVSSGGNDAILDRYQPGTYPAARSLQEMSAVFDRLQAAGALVIYLSLTPPYAGGERLGQISTIARQKGVIVVDGMAGLWGNKDLMSDDIHPNNKGYEIMCHRIVIAVKSLYP